MDRGLATIKAVVIGMGGLIVAITVVIVVVIIDRATDSVTAGPEPASEAAVPAEPASFADVAVALPAGGRVVTMTGDGDVLSLLVQAGGGTQSIVTIDRRSGQVLNTLELLPRTEGE